MLSVGGVWQACDHMYQVQTLAICHHWPQTCPAVPEEGTVTTFYIGCISSTATVLCCPEKVRDTDHCERHCEVVDHVTDDPPDTLVGVLHHGHPGPGAEATQGGYCRFIRGQDWEGHHL